MRDCVAGGDAVKGGRDALPARAHGPPGAARRLSSEYAAYKTRALFYNATGRSVDGLSGMVFRRPPITDLPTSAEPLTDNVDLIGRTLDDFADACLREVLTTGRCGVLVEHTTAPVEQPVEPAEPARPYLVLYDTESILDVVHETVGGVRRLARVRLHEAHEEPSEADEFGIDNVERVRVLELIERRLRAAAVPAGRRDERAGAGDLDVDRGGGDPAAAAGRRAHARDPVLPDRDGRGARAGAYRTAAASRSGRRQPGALPAGRGLPQRAAHGRGADAGVHRHLGARPGPGAGQARRDGGDLPAAAGQRCEVPLLRRRRR